MILFIIIIIIITVIILIVNKQNEKWYNSLTEEERNTIRRLDLKLVEVNPTVRKNMPPKYMLYKMLYELSNQFTKDEEILFFSKYTTRVENLQYNSGPMGYIYITNKRILTVDNQNKNIPIEKISSVSSNKNNMLINDNLTGTKLFGIPKDDVTKIIKIINDEMENHKTISININKTTEKDIADKIVRLKSLYDDGILTEYEFNMKKMELLEKESKD